MKSPPGFKIVWIAAACCGAGLRVASAQTADAVTDCDRYAASDFDRQSPAPGIRFDRIDPKLAIPACLEAASKHPDSARLNFQLGRAYDANKDFPEARKFFLKAAGSNFALAEVNLGSLYFNGQGVEKNYSEAARWDRLAADQGLAPAQAALGSMYVAGRGVAQDYAEAQRLLRLAAAQGFAPAQNGLGALYANGQGVKRDFSEAMKWYALAAAQNYAPAQTSLDALKAIMAHDAQAAAPDAAGDAIAARPRTRPDASAPRYAAAPAGEGYSPVKIVVKSPDSRISNRVAAIAIEISPLSPNFSMTGFAVNKGDCRVYIQDPTALLARNSAERTDAEGAKTDGERQAAMDKISLVSPPFDPPVAAALGQYMTFYVDPSACALQEVEVLVNGFEWKWTPE